MSSPLPTASPESHGLSGTAINRLVAELEHEGLDPHALVIARHGTVLYRGAWAPWAADRAALVYSVSKTFTALAIGFLAEDGLLAVTEPVDRYLDLPNPHGLSVRHLLTMNTGHTAEQISALPFDVGLLLSTPPAHAPGTHFAYNSPASFALSAIVTAVSGRSLTGLLGERLLAPLGIGRRWWATCDGLDQGFSGLHLTVDDLARIGIALADGGRYGGRQVIPRAFLQEATEPWSDTSEHDAVDGVAGDWNRGYGYQLWRSRHGFRLDGAYGQFSLVVPERGIVIGYQGATVRTQQTLDAMWRLVEAFQDGPVAGSEAPLPDPAALDAWESWALLEPTGPATDQGWALADAEDGGWELTLPGRDRTVAVSSDAWRHALLGGGEDALAIAARGERTPDGAVRVHVVVPSSPHRAILVRDTAGLRIGWHTTPLWAPAVDTLLTPAWVADPAEAG